MSVWLPGISHARLKEKVLVAHVMMSPHMACFLSFHSQAHSAPEDHPLIRISFIHPDRTPGSISTSPTHNIYLVSNPPSPSSSISASEIGAGYMLPAKMIMAGNKIVVKTPTGFSAVTVTAAEEYTGNGWYSPALESPYIVVDGVVAPVHISFPVPLTNQAGPLSPYQQNGIAFNALVHLVMMPLWMQQLQANGTAGKDGQWDGSPIWPEGSRLKEIVFSNVMKGKAFDMARAYSWGMQKYAAWTADKTAIPAADEVFQAFAAAFV